MTTTSRLRLGQLLVDAGLLTPEALEGVLAAQQRDARRLGALLVERGHVTEVQLTQILSHQLSVPWVSLHMIEFSRQLLNLVPRDLAERYCLLPIYVRRVRHHGDTLYIAMEDPSNDEALRECASHAGLPVRPMIAPPSDIRAAIRAYFGAQTAETEPPPPPEAAPAEALATAPAPAPAAPDPVSPAEPRAAPPVVPAGPSPSLAAAPAGPARPLAVDVPPRVPHATTLRSAVFEEVSSRGATASADDLPPIVRDSRPTPVPATSLSDIPETVRDDGEPVLELTAARKPPSSHPAAPARPRSIPAPRGKAPKMMSLTLLDGTTITLPAPKRGAKERQPEQDAEAAGPESVKDPTSFLTARDLVGALQAVAGGADPRAVLGDDMRWEAMFAALLSVLLKKQLVADWEFVEELNRLRNR